VLLILLVFVAPFLVAAPGALFALVEAPEFFGRRPQRRPAPRYRWQVA
jgi:hypothetical protein